jgi:hypothetical protein
MDPPPAGAEKDELPPKAEGIAKDPAGGVATLEPIAPYPPGVLKARSEEAEIDQSWRSAAADAEKLSAEASRTAGLIPELRL